ncbi:MAG: SDR family oxidoreductase [Sedimentisphaerales bacterium]|nr:SDR family oxidoreductase [Sedimentisphaerales bacterium]
MEGSLFDLSGKTALVTGGSRGIGMAIAKGLARHGANIAIIARTKRQLNQAQKQIQADIDRKVWTFPFDLANTEKIAALFDGLIKQTKGIDILVNCAGITRRAPAEEANLTDWKQVIEVNLNAVFVISQAFCRHCKQTGSPGKIINIGSLMCQAARPTNTAYACSKGGVLMLTKSLAVEWAKYNINVNAIGPGYIATDLTAPLQTDPNLNNWVISKTPLGRWGQPDDLVGAAVFLASSASDFITGQIIYVDGGWLAML